MRGRRLRGRGCRCGCRCGRRDRRRRNHLSAQEDPGRATRRGRRLSGRRRLHLPFARGLRGRKNRGERGRGKVVLELLVEGRPGRRDDRGQLRPDRTDRRVHLGRRSLRALWRGRLVGAGDPLVVARPRLRVEKGGAGLVEEPAEQLLLLRVHERVGGERPGGVERLGPLDRLGDGRDGGVEGHLQHLVQILLGQGLHLGAPARAAMSRASRPSTMVANAFAAGTSGRSMRKGRLARSVRHISSSY